MVRPRLGRTRKIFNSEGAAPEIARVKAPAAVMRQKKNLGKMSMFLWSSLSPSKRMLRFLCESKNGTILRHRPPRRESLKTRLPGKLRIFHGARRREVSASTGSGQLDVAHSYEPPKTSFRPLKNKPRLNPNLKKPPPTSRLPSVL